MCLNLALTLYGRMTELDESVLDGIQYSLRECGRNPFEFQIPLDTPSVTAEKIDEAIRDIVDNPEKLYLFNQCISEEMGKNLELVYCSLQGFKVAPTV